MATFTVTSDSEWAAALAAAVSGDTILLEAEVLAAFAPAFHRHDVADVYGQTLTLGDEKTLTPGIQFCDLNYPPEPPRPGETVWVRDVCAPVSSEEN